MVVWDRRRCGDPERFPRTSQAKNRCSVVSHVATLPDSSIPASTSNHPQYPTAARLHLAYNPLDPR